MVYRKEQKAANVWYKLGRPIIKDGERAGQRDSERITATLQVIPDTAFDGFGNRLLNGFTLDELRDAAENKKDLVIRNREGNPTALVRIGDDDFSFSVRELKQIIKAVEESGVQVLESPMNQDDLEYHGRRKARKEGADARSANATGGDGAKRTRKADSADSES